MSDFLKSLGKSAHGISDFLWLGWPGMSIEASDEQLIRDEIKQIFKASPVFFSQSLMDKVYLGFCNRTIWPLFHYFPQYSQFEMENWTAYLKMNQIYRDELLKIIKPDDIIWIHDYHLMLLPKLLREKIANPIGFFLHIPFPAYEMYRTLQKEPRTEILKGLLGSDQVGFHTHDYTQYFLRCVLRILGRENHMGEIAYHDRIVKVSTFPMGIDYAKFHGMRVAPYRSAKPGPRDKKIVLSVDRLDYTKGILNRLQGFELFLKRNPDWHKKVSMNMIVVPSRTGVESYREIKNSLDQLVGKINGSFGCFNWVPIVYQFTSLPHKQLIAQYRRSNVSLLTPLRDGMNLVAKEYVASLRDKKGVLILSEFTGAAKELSESIIINPNNIDEIADAIEEALTVPVKLQIKNNTIMQQRLKRYNVTHWAEDFIENLVEIHKGYTKTYRKKKITPQTKAKIYRNFREARNRVLILDYDGILIPFSKDYHESRPSPRILKLLKDLNKKAKMDILINSGRSRSYMDKWFAKLNLNMTAEHVTWIKEAGEKEWKLLKPHCNDWKEEIMPILEIYTDRLPGSIIEEKELSVSWYYHRSDIEQASYISRELVDNLLPVTNNMNVHVQYGNKVVEVYNSGISKPELVKHCLDRKKYDFILALAADWSDEELFPILPEYSFSIKIGKIYTNARYKLRSQAEAIALLEYLRRKSTGQNKTE